MHERAKLPGKVAIIYPFLPHYRYGVFHELDNLIDDLVFFSDESSGESRIATTPPGAFEREEKVVNKRLGRTLWQQGLGKKLFKYNPDTLIFLGDVSYLSTWFYSIIARLMGKKVYFWTIGWHRPEGGLKRLLRLTFYRCANSLLLYWEAGRNIGINSGYPASKMRLIYNSYESSTNESRERLDLNKLPDDSLPMIGAVSRLSPNKNLQHLINAAAILKAKHNLDVGCLIVGEGAIKDELRSLADRLSVQLYLPGAIYHAEDLKEIYKRLVTTVIPMNAGLTVLQSLSAGTPVVTIDDPYNQGPEYEAIQDGFNGSLTQDASPESIADAVALWIGKKLDGTLDVETICKSSVNEKWSPQAQAEAIMKAITSAGK